MSSRPSKKAKILFVISRYGNQINGGAEWHCRQIAQRLASKFEVHVATTKALDHNTWQNYFKEDEEELNGVKVFRFKVDYPRTDDITHIAFAMERDKTNPGIALGYIKAQGPYSTKLNKFVEDNFDKYQKIIVFQHLYAPSYFAVKNIPPGKLILVPLAHEEKEAYMSVYRELFKKPKWIIYNSAAEKRLINKVHHNQNLNSEIIGGGVEVNSDYKKTEFRQKFKIHGKYIVFVGRLEIAKRVDVLVEDFLAFKKTYPTSTLKLVLVGKEITPISDHPDIVKTGFVTDDEKYAIMSEAVTLVNPSPFESLSLIVLESFLVGRPVLVNGYCDVMVDHCLHSNGGLWYKTEKEFVAQLNFLIANPKKIKQMGANGHKYVKANYNWVTIMKKWEKVLTNRS